MAEILGIVAAALQLTETALKLKRLCSSIHNAPTELHFIAGEITDLADQLSSTDFDFCGRLMTPYSHLARCQTLFEESVKPMMQLVTDLENSLQTRRLTATFRAYLKRDELATCKSRLESIRNRLILAQQAYHSAILSKQNKHLDQILLEIRASVALQQTQQATIAQYFEHRDNIASTNNDIQIQDNRALAEWQPQRVRYQHEIASTNDNGQIQGVKRLAKWKSQHASKDTSKYNIRMPSWMFSKGLHVLINRSNSAWGVTLRTYSMLPEYSPLFQAAFSRDWCTVQAMFRERTASPFDINPIGWTLLHVAACQSDAAACIMLMNLGLEPLHLDHCDNDAISMPNATLYDSSKHFDLVLDTRRALLSHPDVIVEPHERKLRHYFFAQNPDGLKLMIDAVSPPYHGLDRHIKARLATDTWIASYKGIDIILGPDLDLPQALDLVDEYDESELYIFLRSALGHVSFSQRLGNDEEEDGWMKIALTTIHHKISKFGRFLGSPLAMFFDKYFYQNHSRESCKCQSMSFNEYFTQIARGWITTLRDRGMDLESYGKLEQNCASRAVFAVRHRTMKIDYTYYELRHIVYGPQVENWKVFVVEVFRNGDYCAEYEMAGPFWNWVENPELFGIPGAYLPHDCSGEY